MTAAPAVALCALAFLAAAAPAQPCPGDFDFDQRVTAADLPEGAALLFGKFGDFAAWAPALRAIADVNADGAFSVPDLDATVRRLGTTCGAGPSPSPSPTSTPTARSSPSATASPSATVSPSPTRAGPSPTGTPSAAGGTTRSPTPTPTRTRTPRPTLTACPVTPLAAGTVGGALAEGDCTIGVSGQQRYADRYTFVAPVGVAVRIDVAAAGFTPQVSVMDPGGHFGTVRGAPPVEFASTTGLPYEIVVSSAANSPSQAGAYTLSVSTRPCPAPVNLALPQNAEFTAGDCPDPASPSVGRAVSPADQYFFDVTLDEVPRSIRLQMTAGADVDVDPEFAVLGPDGYELLYAAEDNLVVGTSEFNEEARFLALQPGRYTVIASGFGGLGRYRIALVSQPQCRTRPLPAFADSRPVQVPGTLYGAITGTRSTACPAPLRPPLSDGDTPEPNSPADIYTFRANAGDVVSFLMDSEDDPYLFLIGPTDCAQAGAGCVPKRLLATDDESGEIGAFSAQFATTIVHPGTYLLVAANAFPLEPPLDGDPGDAVAYTVFAQRCPARGPLTVNAPPRADTFDISACRGAGGLPLAAYAVAGTAGSFIAATAGATGFDATVRIVAPDGGSTHNDNDPFAADSRTAVASRVLPLTGTYYVEVGASPEEFRPSLVPPVPYSVAVRSCAVDPAVPDTLRGSLAGPGCTLPDGRRYAVHGFQGPADPDRPDAVSVVVPDGFCAVATLASGMHVPVTGCASGRFEFPLVAGRTGLIVAAGEGATAGPYEMPLARCAAPRLSFGTVVSGRVGDSSCRAAGGAPGERFLIRAPAGLVTFLDNGIYGWWTGGSDLVGRVTDALGVSDTDGEGRFLADTETLFALGEDLALLLGIEADRRSGGSFEIHVDAGSRRQ